MCGRMVKYSLPFVVLQVLIREGFFIAISFNNCGLDNWSCNDNSNATKLTFHCERNINQGNIEFNLQDLVRNHPVLTIRSITLSDCEKMTVDIHLDRPSQVKKIHFQRIGELEIKGCKDISSSPYHPADIILEDIGYIAELHTETITSSFTEDVIFTRVFIGHIHTGAVTNPSGKLNLLIWDTVRIGTLSPESVVINVDSEGSFKLINANIGQLIASAFIIHGGMVIISQSLFREIDSAAIAAYARTFQFFDNKVSGNMGRLTLICDEISFKHNQYGGCSGIFQLDWRLLINKKEDTNDVHLISEGNTLCANEEKKTETCRFEEKSTLSTFNCTINSDKYRGDGNDCDNSDLAIVSFSCGNICLKGVCNEANSPSLRLWKFFFVQLCFCFIKPFF